MICGGEDPLPASHEGEEWNDLRREDPLPAPPVGGGWNDLRMYSFFYWDLIFS